MEKALILIWEADNMGASLKACNSERQFSSRSLNRPFILYGNVKNFMQSVSKQVGI